MATRVTDKLFEVFPRLAGKVGAGGVISSSSTTIPHTFVGLTDGHCYLVTANRTNAAGTTKNQLNDTETFIGKVSAGNFIECVRQVEGVAQAWGADTVLEILFTATAWNKLLENVLTHANQDGTLKVLNSLAILGTAVDIDGTLAANSDEKVATQKAVKAYIDGKSAVMNRAFSFGLSGGVSVGDEQGMKYIAPQNMTVTAIRHKTGSGTATIRLQKGTTDMDAGISVTSSAGNETTITTPSISAGDVITLDVTAASSCVDLFVVIECTQP